MSHLNTRRPWTFRDVFIFFLIGGLLGFALIVVLLIMSGRSPITSTAEFVEFRICLENGTYQPVNIVPAGTKQLYICGIVNGQGILTGALHLYQGDKMLQGRYFEQFPGVFYQAIFLDEGIEIGAYTVDVFSAKRVIAQTEFSVVEVAP